MVGARSMVLLLRQQKSTGVQKTNSPPLMPALPLLTSHPSLAYSISGAVKLRAERTHPRNISNRAKAKEECDGKIKEYEVATSAAKVHRCSGVKLATTHACNAAAAVTSHPSSAVLNPVSILRTNKTVFPQHAPVVLDTYFELSQAHKALEIIFNLFFGFPINNIISLLQGA